MKQQITEYINSIGVEAASEFFNRKSATIKSLLKTERWPIDIVEKYLSIMDGEPEPATPATQEHPAEATSSFEVSVTNEINSLRTRVQAIEDFLVTLNQVPQAPQNGFNRVAVPWAPPEPQDSNVTSFVRPGTGVPGSTLSTPAPIAGPRTMGTVVGLRPGMTAANSWLTPIPKKS